VSGSYLQDWLLYDTDWNWRVERDRGGELRAVSDIGSHWLDLVSYVIDQPLEAVSADLATFIPVRLRPEHSPQAFARPNPAATEPVEIDTDDAACLLLRWAGGVRGALTVSQVSAGRKNALSVEINCASGSLHWNSERPDELWLGHRDRPNETLLRDPSLLHPAAAVIATMPGGHGEGFENTFKQLFAAVYADIRRGGPVNAPAYPTFAAGHRSALVSDAVAASAAERRWVQIAWMPTEVPA
jgi:predicted dehydrogenase